MLDNMDTIALMEKAKSGYIQTRRIKAYILWVKLKNLGMWDEYNELEATLTQQWVKMISENELI
jgi:hypothetical protein